VIHRPFVRKPMAPRRPPVPCRPSRAESARNRFVYYSSVASGVPVQGLSTRRAQQRNSRGRIAARSSRAAPPGATSRPHDSEADEPSLELAGGRRGSRWRAVDLPSDTHLDAGKAEVRADRRAAARDRRRRHAAACPPTDRPDRPLNLVGPLARPQAIRGRHPVFVRCTNAFHFVADSMPPRAR